MSRRERPRSGSRRTETGGGVTPWHADQYYWPLATDRSVTVWVPLQETPLPMGPLSFARAG